MANTTTVLIVECDRDMRHLLHDEFWSAGYRIREAQDGEEALRAVLETPPDIILTDLHLPAGATDYISRLHRIAPQCPILVMTAFGGAQVRDNVMQAGASAYFDKPVRISDIRAKVEGLLFNSNWRVCDGNRQW
ncbi:MAG: response regulator [Nitrospira sp.]|nr:response regulator [Nitrospira sp. BO4]